MKLMCLWIKHEKKTKPLFERLMKMRKFIILSKKSSSSTMVIIPKIVWMKLESLIDNAAKHVHAQALYAKTHVRSKSLADHVKQIKEEKKIIAISEKVLCSKIDDYNKVKRAMYYMKTVERQGTNEKE